MEHVGIPVDNEPCTGMLGFEFGNCFSIYTRPSYLQVSCRIRHLLKAFIRWEVGFMLIQNFEFIYADHDILWVLFLLLRHGILILSSAEPIERADVHCFIQTWKENQWWSVCPVQFIKELMVIMIHRVTSRWGLGWKPEKRPLSRLRTGVKNKAKGGKGAHRPEWSKLIYV